MRYSTKMFVLGNLLLLLLFITGCIHYQPQTPTNITQPNGNLSNNLPNIENKTNVTIPAENQSAPSKPVIMTYSASCVGVEFNKSESIDLIPNEDGFSLIHILPYYCCANISLDVKRNNTNIVILEKNTGGICKCMCTYQVTATVHGLASGEYSVSLVGVYFHDPTANITQEPELRLSKIITIGKLQENETNEATTVECETDFDCVHMPSCCHPGAQQCVPKSSVENITLDCKNVYCTMDCRPCTVCKCVNGKCVTEIAKDELNVGCC